MQNDPKTSMEIGKFFPHLDAELVWADNRDAQFRVHLKPNQQLLWLNADSIHTNHVSKPSLWVSAKDCLNWQQSRKQTRIYHPTKSTHNTSKLCNRHAGIVSKKSPNLDWTTTAQWRSQSYQTSQGLFQQWTKRKENNLLLPWMFQHLVWTCPFNHQKQSIKDKFNLQWLRVSMSCPKCTNLREIFQGHLFRKLTVGLTSQCFEPAPVTA